MADELLVHYRGGVGKSNEKGGGVPLELGSRKGGFEGDAFLNQKAVFILHFVDNVYRCRHM